MLDQTNMQPPQHNETGKEAGKPKRAPVEFSNVSLRIDGEPRIRNISCKLSPISKTIVMGANGAGKSLFLRLFAGLLKPDTGRISGGVYDHGKDDESCLSMVFQKPVLLRRSAFANIVYVLDQKKTAPQQQENMVYLALKQARLEKSARTPARKLSGGEQQRLALARALVVEPDILLLDEATANLDPASTYIVERMINQAASKGTKIVFVTHDVRQAKRLADDILFVHNGEILAHKPAKEFFRDPGSKHAQAYLDGRLPEAQFEE